MKNICFFVLLIVLFPTNAYALSSDSLFNEICTIIDKNFYDSTFKGINWPMVKQTSSEAIKSVTDNKLFASEINKMLLKLNASHTHYYTSDDPEYYHLSDIFSSSPHFKKSICTLFPACSVSCTGIGIFTEKVGDDFFVSSVLDSFPAYKAGILRGDKIILVDGKPFEPVVSFREKAGKKVTIVVQRNEDSASLKTFIITPINLSPNEMFTEAMTGSARIIANRGKKIGYVHVWSFMGEQYYDLLKQLLVTRFDSCDALILDIRDGYGGASPEYLGIFSSRVPVLQQKARGAAEWFTFNPQWKKPVVLLTNGNTRSGKECFAYAFRKYGYGTAVGTKTEGAFLGGRPFFLSNGSMLFLAVSNIMIDGEILEGKGVKPDITVEQPLIFSAGNDPQLQKAVEVAFNCVKK